MEENTFSKFMELQNKRIELVKEIKKSNCRDLKFNFACQIVDIMLEIEGL